MLSRLLFYFMGVRFDASGLDWYWQYLDVELLKHDLLGSLFYQHSQPPLFNLYLGAVLKLFPETYVTAFSLTFKGLSLLLYVTLYRVMRRTGFRNWIAYAAATLFMVHPTVVLYENWLFYTWPTAVLLACAAFQLLRFEQEHRVRNAFLYLSCIAAVCLMRSMFHFVYLAAGLVPLFLIHHQGPRRIRLAASAAMVLVLSLYLKNLLVFGFLGSSSWMGMNLWKVAPTGGKEDIIASVPVVQQEPFSAISDYPDSFRSVPDRFSDIPALAYVYRENAEPNLNHYGYLEISDIYKETSVRLILMDPPGYLGITVNAWRLYMSPAHGYPLLAKGNLEALRAGMLAAGPFNPRLLVPGALLLAAWGLAHILLSRWKMRSTFPEPLFFAFCAGTVFYAAILGNLLEHGENMRFRVQTDPLLYIAAWYASLQLIRRLRRPSVRG